MAGNAWQDNSDDWSIPGDWSLGKVPGAGDDVTIAQGDPAITTDEGTIASVTITAAGQAVLENGGALTTSGDIDNAGTLGVDTGENNGGSHLTIGNGLNNSGTFQIGFGPGDIFLGLTASDLVTAAALSNAATATINLVGNGSHQAALSITATAGFGTAGVLTGEVNLYNDALLAFGQGQINTIAASSALLLSGAATYLADSNALSSNSALTGLSSIVGSLSIDGGATVAVGGDLDVTGTLGLDNGQYAGGSTLNIAGTLSNSSTVQIGFGPGDIFLGLTASDLMTAAALDNAANATLNIVGNGANQAVVDIAGAAGFGTAGVVTGQVNLYNNALLEFGQGQITSIAAGSELTLQGAQTFVADSSDKTHSSALTGLSTVAGTFNVESGASVAIGGDLAITGTLDVDGFENAGGSQLAIGGTLTNDSTIQIGFGPGDIFLGIGTSDLVSAAALDNGANATLNIVGNGASQAVVDIAGAAGSGTAGVLTGQVNLYNNALLEFGQGQITSIAAGSELTLQGAQTFVADSSDETHSSALTGLSSVAGTLNISYGAALTTSGDLNISGTLDIDTAFGGGGSLVDVGGTLINSGAVQIGFGPGDIFLGLSSSVLTQVGALDNSATGTITLVGHDAIQAAISVAGVAGTGTAGVLSGHIDLYNNALLEFGSGQITSIASDGELSLLGPDTFVADSSDTSHNSALSSLAENAGSLSLENGQSITTSGDFATSGFFGLDNNGTGSSATIGGTLTNSGTVDIGNNGISAQTFLTVAALDNTGSGLFNVSGSVAATAVLVVQGQVTNAATLNLYNGVSAEVGSLVNSGSLNIYGNLGVPTSLEIFGTASNSGALLVGAFASMDVGGAFTDAGALTLAGTLDLGAGGEVASGGTILLQGGSIITPASAVLTLDAGSSLSGAGSVGLGLASDATITASGGLLDLVGAVTGTGSLAIANASELELGGATAQSVSFGGSVGTLKLDQPAAFSGSISGLVLGDTIDLAGVQATSAVVNGSTLTVTAGSQTFSYQVAGALAGNTFALEDDQQGGTDLVLGTPGPVISGPKAQTVFSTYPAVLGPLKIQDPSAGAGILTAVITAGTGLLATATAGAGTVSDNVSSSITLTGDLTDINAELAALAYLGGNAGQDNVSITVTDANNLVASQTIAVTTKVVPYTTPVLNSPAASMVIEGSPTAIGGVTISDPFSEASGLPDALEVTSNVQSSFQANGSGGLVTGQNTDDTTIFGTPSQINAYFADDFLGTELSIGALIPGTVGSLATGAGLIYKVYQAANGKANIGDGISAFNSILKAVKPLNIQGAISPPADFLEVGVSAASFVLNAAAALATTGQGVTQEQWDAFEHSLYKILAGKLSFILVGDPQIVTSGGTTYDLNVAGEFILAQSTQAGNSFAVQGRLQPASGSQSASLLTEIAAEVGSEKVTFGIGRADTLWIDGQAETSTPGATFTLDGGQVTQLSANTFQVTWNTGEVLNVTNNGSSLALGIGLGSGDGPGSIAGLLGTNNGAAGDFVLPDGTALPQPLTSAELYGTFANAWRVTSANSLFDYGPNQTTADFTDLNFPEATITLADLPASVVAQAAQMVAAAGITDPSTAAGIELDYIQSGGSASVLTQDVNQLKGLTTTAAAITQSSPAPAVLGVIAAQDSVTAQTSGSTTVTFDVYLTAAASQDTIVNYTVVAPDAGDFQAADFQGQLPSGSVTIAAGSTTAQITITVPQGALGALPSKSVALQISTPGPVPVYAPTATEAVSQVLPGPPAVPELDYLSTLGTLTRSGNNYTLDLGAIQVGELLPQLQFGIVNAATSPADQLTGTFTVAPVAGFSAAGASIPTPIDAGSSYQGLTVQVDQNKFGANSETVTFNPVDTNASGFTAPLTPLTLTITDTLELPSMVYSQAWGDVHIITYNGLTYNFQAVGEFTLAHSNIPGDSFDIQLRLAPWHNGAQVTTIQEVAIALGTDRVTFDWTRADPVYVDGVASSISQADPVLTLDGGTVTEVSATVFKVAWTTGETMTVTNAGNYINVVDGIPGVNGPGAYSGLQGEDEGQSNDIQLPDGTVLPQPVSNAELYGEYADAWRVSQATSLFDYGPGQTTATFTDRNFPADALSLSDLPSSVVAAAVQTVAAAGITDPGIAQAAELDYIATGDPSFITGAQNIQQQVFYTTPATVTESTAPATALGVEADAQTVTEAASGATAVTFTAYLTSAASTDTTISYDVLAPGAGFLDAAAFGGTLPSGSVTIAAGATSAQFTIDVPEGALGVVPAQTLEVAVTAPAGVQVFAPTAQSEIANSTPEAGNPAIAQLAYLGDSGTFSFDAETNSYTLDLGALAQNSAEVAAQFAVINAATGQADNLFGSFSSPSGTGFIVTGNSLPSPLAPGATYQGLLATIKTYDLGPNGMTLTFTPQDVNDSGYAANLTPLTLHIVDSIVPPATAALNTPGTIIFPNVRVGTPDSQAVSITNSAAAGAESLDVTALAGASASVSGAISQLAPGATDASDLVVGVDTSKAGAASGSVQLVPSSDNGAGVTTPLEAPDTYIDVFGSAYRLAAPAISTTSTILHVGDAGTTTLTIANGDPADGYSESLIAALAGATGAISPMQTGPTGDILAGASNATALKLGFSTASAGTVSGSAIVDLTSDGGTGASSIDGLGQVALAPQTVPIAITIDNYAKAALAETAGGGTFAATEGGYTLDLGTIAQGASPVSVSLAALNAAAGPADLLAGSFTEVADSAFTNALGAVSGIAAGQSTAAGTVTLATGNTGQFSDVITFGSTGSNASGYSGALANETLTITGTVADETPPSLVISTDEPQITAASAPANITFTFSEAVKGFDAGDVTVTGGTLGAITQSQTNPEQYSALFTATPGFVGTGSVDVAAATYTDLAGNPGAAGATEFSEDLTAPAVAVSSSEPQINAASAPATISFAFTTAVTGFDASDVTATGGALGAITQSASDPKLYSATFTPTPGFVGQGLVAVAAGSYSDLAGNPGAAGSTSFAEDLASPSVAVSADAVALDAASPPTTILFAFSKAITGFDASDVTVTGGTLGTITQSQTNPDQYSATFTATPGFTGEGTIAVTPGSYADLAGNLGAGGSTNIAEDLASPSVAVIAGATSLNAATGTTTILFAFSKAVTGFDASDVTATGGTLGPILQSQTDPDRYSATFTATPGFVGLGSVAVAAGSYTDLAGNAGAGGSTPLTEDLAPPSVLGIATSGSGIIEGAGDLGPDQSVTFTLTTSAPVDVTGGIPTLTLDDGGTATYSGGSGTNALTFVYTSAPGENSADLTITGAATNGASLTDAAGNALDLTGAIVDPPGTLVIDTTAPSVAISTPAGTTATAAQTITGTGEAGTTVQLFDNSASSPLATATVDANGQWSAAVTLADGANAFEAFDTDAAGNTGASAVVDIAFSGVSSPILTAPPTNATVSQLVPPPTITFDSTLSFKTALHAVLSGTVSAADGVASVAVYADGGRIFIGDAAVHADGSWTINDKPGPVDQNFLTAVATSASGQTASATADYALEIGVTHFAPGQPHSDVQNSFDASGDLIGQSYFQKDGGLLFANTLKVLSDGDLAYSYTGGTFFDSKDYSAFTDVYAPDRTLLIDTRDNNDGSHLITGFQNDLTFKSIGDDTFLAQGTQDRFVFTDGFGQDTITDFKLGGADHDTLSLPGADFTTLAAMLHDTSMSAGNAVIQLNAQDSITLDGITKAEMKLHGKDFVFHA